MALAMSASALWTPADTDLQARHWLAAMGVGQALAFVACAAIASQGRVVAATLLACYTGLFAVFGSSLLVSFDISLRMPGFLGYLVSACAVFVSRRAAVLLAGLSMGVVLATTQLRPGQPVSAVVVELLLILTGLIIGVLSSFALTRTLTALRQREQRFQALLGIAADWYWEQDEELRFTHISAYDVDDTGMDAHQQIGRRRWEIPELTLSEAQWDAHRADLYARRPFRNLIMRRPNVGGKPRYVTISGEPIFDADGTFRGYWGVGRIVTEEIQAQRLLQSSEERYRELFERSPTPMVAHRNGIVVHSNAAAAQLLGYPSPASTIDADFSKHFPEGELRRRALERTAQIMSMPLGDPLPTVDYQLIRLDGRTIDVLITSLPVQLDDGPAALTICEDMTARKAAEQALRHSQTLLSKLFDTTPDVVTLVEYSTGRYLMVNDRFTQLLGWTRDEVLGRSTVELGMYVDPKARDHLRRQLRELGSMRDILINFRSKSGAVIPLRMSAALLTFDAIDYVVTVARDVSAAEQSRLEREAILNNASIGIGFTRDRRFVLANPYFERMFGWPTGSLAGQPGSVVWPSEEEYAEIGRIASPLLAKGQPFETERTMSRRDGSSFWCRLSARVVDPTDPSRGGTIWIVEDITERRQVERSLAAARDAAEAASRAKSAFLANTSHEIRTPLNGLLGLARLAQQPDVGPELRERYVAQIFESAQALTGIIADILDLSKIEAGKLSLETVPFNLRELLGGLCDSYAALAEARGLRLERQLDPTLPAMVRGDPVRVRQIIGNYLANALKFTERGSVTLEVSRAPGELLHFVVSDTGQGIDLVTQGRLFRPFVQADDSTTRRYGGTGLGLSICLELATLMGGAVGVDSKPKRGSRFWADLPLPAVLEDEMQEAGVSGFESLISGARVLVVEDNAVNLLIVRAMLEGWGMQVVEASDGQQALDAIEQAAESGALLDLVLMDLQMPVMSGYEAARRIRQRPDGASLPIIALTAAALLSERDQALAAGMDAFLTKPIDPAQLRATLARTLGGRSRG